MSSLNKKELLITLTELNNIGYYLNSTYNYNVIVLDQALKGQNYINFTNANTVRASNGRDANVAGVQGQFFTKNQAYLFGFNVKNSLVLENAETKSGVFANVRHAKWNC